MSNFTKLTTRNEDGSYKRIWLDKSSIKELSQNSATQGGLNEGTCVLIDGTTIELISFNETLDTLN
jgi:hypothetical protein